MDSISKNELERLISKTRLEIFYNICDYIDSKYDMEKIWNNGGKKWDYEYKFRKSSKTLCSFYFKDNCLGLMFILGKEERNKIEENRNNYSKEFLEVYDNTKTYHDGKWVMLELNDLLFLEDIKKLLLVKRKHK